MRVMDGLLCFPPILLGIFVVTFLGPSLRKPDPGDRRPLRPPLHASRAREHPRHPGARVRGERAGARGTAVRVVAGAILPNIVAPILVQASLAAGHAILLESGLSFLGLGRPRPRRRGDAWWSSRCFMQLSALPLLWPSAAISFTVLAFNLLGTGSATCSTPASAAARERRRRSDPTMPPRSATFATPTSSASMHMRPTTRSCATSTGGRLGRGHHQVPDPDAQRPGVEPPHRVPPGHRPSNGRPRGRRLPDRDP